MLPDIPISEEGALSAAYSMALKSIIESIGEPASGPSGKLLEEAQVALKDMELI